VKKEKARNSNSQQYFSLPALIAEPSPFECQFGVRWEEQKIFIFFYFFFGRFFGPETFLSLLLTIVIIIIITTTTLTF
jgi:hypothetical protein